MILASSSIMLKMVLWPLPRMNDSAAPKNSENTRICRISLLAIASAMLLGKTWVMKVLSVKSPVFRPEVRLVSGSARFRWAPGWNTFTSIRPSSSEMAEAVMNQNMARRPMRPTALASLMLARPETRWRTPGAR